MVEVHGKRACGLGGRLKDFALERATLKEMPVISVEATRRTLGITCNKSDGGDETRWRVCLRTPTKKCRREVEKIILWSAS